MRTITLVLVGLLAVGCVLAGIFTPSSSAGDKAGDISTAICPVVYSLDESVERGYHYIFYGNAFFINREGYLLTAAHVLSDFQNGAEPQILVRRAEAPPRLLKVEVIGSDSQHDVAILRAVPNPFDGKYQVAFLRLSASNPVAGAPIVAEALRPGRMKDPHTFDAPQEDKSLADVLQYTSIALDKGAPKADLFLFNHEVIRGQSGAPILSRNTEEVVGFVEGQWLHGVPLSSPTSPGDRGSTMGAGVPITYALPLLEQKHVAWQAISASSN
jgi:S1-C subfamily serine protease